MRASASFGEYESFEEWHQHAMLSVAKLAKAASTAVPASVAEFTMMTSSEALGRSSSALARQIEALCRAMGSSEGDFFSNSLEDSVHNYEAASEATDACLERVDLFLDHVHGSTFKLPQPSPRALQQQHQQQQVTRPQITFADMVDNSSSTFLPRLREKPNAMVPLDPLFDAHASASSADQSTISKAMEMHLESTLGMGMGNVMPHPYEYELQHFEYRADQLERCAKPTPPASLDSTPYRYIESPDALDELVDQLRKEAVIAVDLEQHFFRSFQGFLCLMQITCSRGDFLVDTLALRSHMWVLNRVMTDPNVVKVMHGADHDVEWLQRDASVYIVNLFDTGQAARVLNFPKKSLAFLLQRYCDVTADKQYQLSDWRIRPLPQEMIKYAREDTHYLLYIYDLLRNELLDRNQLQSVLARSRALCQKVYQKPIYSETDYLGLYNKYRSGTFSTPQLNVFASLYEWRDIKARAEDESTAFVMPNRMMLLVAEKMPETVEALLGMCIPTPPLVRADAHELTALIRRARASTSEGPVSGASNRLAIILDRARQQRDREVARISATTSEWQPAPKELQTSVMASPQGKLFSRSQSPANKDKGLQQAVEEIGASFDPLFTARVRTLVMQDEVEEEQHENETPKRKLVDVTSEKPLPKSLAEIHKISSRNKRRRKDSNFKTDTANPPSPLNLDRLGNAAEAPSASGFLQQIGYQPIEDFDYSSSKSKFDKPSRKKQQRKGGRGGDAPKQEFRVKEPKAGPKKRRQPKGKRR